MHMSFWFGTKLNDFLFYGYNITTTWGFISTCLGLSALAVIYEIMKVFQIRLHEKAKEHNQVSNLVQNTDSSSLISRASERSGAVVNSSKCYMWTRWFIEVFHWSIHVTLGYFLMLAVMTFNGYISTALIMGSGIGYYVFGPILIESNLKKLQSRRKQIECNAECADAVVDADRRHSASSGDSEHLQIEVNVDIEGGT